jgi:HD-GYP domain-containing protein (c-di-GMP phosphodiesterase class II)
LRRPCDTHHESYDGSGYPDKLVGDAIPVGARIIMVADTVDAMTSHRPYRPALGYEDLVSELRRYSGSQFDPSVVDAFLQSGAVKAFLDSRRSPQWWQDAMSQPKLRDQRIVAG